MALRIASKRLAKELNELRTNGPPAGCELLQAEDLSEWFLSISVLGDDTVYIGETFTLRFRFGNNYPLESPEVVFVVDEGKGCKAPVHPHIYTNGHLCLSILGNEWSPVLNVSSILLSIQSMLASCRKKELPPDNARYIRNAPLSPKDTKFVYHDNGV